MIQRVIPPAQASIEELIALALEYGKECSGFEPISCTCTKIKRRHRENNCPLDGRSQSAEVVCINCDREARDHFVLGMYHSAARRVIKKLQEHGFKIVPV